MMKQMKLFTVALMCMMMQTMVCNANHDVMISVSQLPSAAKTFVQKQFRSSRPRPHPQPSERQLPWCRHP